MYCKNCNTYNDDNSRFCSNCGAELDAPTAQATPSEPEQYTQPENQGYENQYSQQPYSQPQQQYSQPQQHSQPQYGSAPYSQPGYNAPASVPFSNTKAIVAIVLNIVVFNVIGLIFAILSLTNYNSYESAFRAGNLTLAEQFKAKSQKYSKIAIILCIVLAVIGVIAGIIAFISVFIFAADHGVSTLDPDVFYEYSMLPETAVQTFTSFIA